MVVLEASAAQAYPSMVLARATTRSASVFVGEGCRKVVRKVVAFQTNRFIIPLGFKPFAAVLPKN